MKHNSRQIPTHAMQDLEYQTRRARAPSTGNMSLKDPRALCFADLSSDSMFQLLGSGQGDSSRWAVWAATSSGSMLSNAEHDGI